MPLTYIELFRVIKTRMNPEEFLEVMDISTSMLVDRFQDLIVDNLELFEDLAKEVIDDAWETEDD